MKQNVQKGMRNMAIIGILGVVVISAAFFILNVNHSRTVMRDSAIDMASLLRGSLVDRMKVGDIKGINRIILELPTDVKGIKSASIAKSSYVKKLFHVKGSASEQQDKVFSSGKIQDSMQDMLGSNPTISVSVPYIAETSCLKCHVNAQKGDILGVISLKLSTKTTQSAAFKSAFIAIIILLLVLSFIIYSIMSNKKMIRTMTKNANNVGSTASTIDISSSELASASDNLAQGAAEQAASLEQIASSMEEMDSMVKQTADNANQANITVEETSAAAAEGMNLVSNLMESAENIKETSDKTAKIIKTIDEIAFQTNLLALNAAVEAARAGEAGAGFAVVAEEVRNLAAKSAEAAKSTAELIERSIDQGAKGVSASEAVSAAIEKVASNADKSKTLTNEIAEAASEQTKGVAQINQGIAQLNEVTQQNSAASEEIAASAKEMTSQSENLITVAGKLGELLGVNINAADSASHKGADKLMRPKSAPKAILNTPSDVIPMTEDALRKF